ncbi:MAG TPA: M23 family metallopeptidase, partial [candidate division Zixibacteria bacterium]
MLKKIIILLFLITSCSPSLAGDYLWPLKGYDLLSSVFGDYRDFHFHAGIDITTGGKTGAKITAPTDGTVFRVFTSYQGYGKAVYLKAEDGKIFVFGHLSDFSPKLSGLVESEQLKNRRYYIDLLTSGIKIRKGEVIGYSGESGYGGPHLHFEMRDGGNHPMNPLVFGFVVPDAIPPIIEKVAIKPVDLSSTVNGLHSWAIMPFSYDEKQKVYTLPDTLVVDGEFGIALSAFDRMNGLRRRFGIYQMKVLLDGELAFFSSYDSLDFDKTYKIDLERKYLSKINKKEEFYELFLEPGNDLNLYLQNKGTINTQAVDSLGKKIYQRGYHQVEILVFDASHNFSLARFYLLFDQSPKLKQVSSEPFENNTKVKVEVLNKYEVSKVHLQTTRLDSIFWGDTIISQQDSQDIYSFILSREPQMVRVRCEDRFGNFSDYKYMLINQDKLSKPPDGYTPSSVRMDYAFDKGNFIFYLFFDKLVLEQPDVWLEAF